MIVLNNNDRVMLFPPQECFNIICQRKFCSNDETRIIVANAIGGKTGTVTKVEDKWRFDYFYFTPDQEGVIPSKEYSIPYECVKFKIEK